MTTIVHAVWSESALHLWGESTESWTERRPVTEGSGGVRSHPFDAEIAGLLAERVPDVAELIRSCASECTLHLFHSAENRTPLPSSRLSLAIGESLDAESYASAVLMPVRVRSVAIPAVQVPTVLARLVELDGEGAESPTILGGSVEFYAEGSRLVRYLLAQQRFIPMLRQAANGEVEGSWQPWLSDEANAARASQLLGAMPAVARAGVDRFNHEAWPILEDFLGAVTDAECRRTLVRETFADSIAEKDARDAHVAWLTGLLADKPLIPVAPQLKQELPRRVRAWIGLLEDRGAGSKWRLCLRLNEPAEVVDTKKSKPPVAEEDLEWTISFHLQSVERPNVILDAADIWILAGDAATVQGQRVQSPQELLLAELGRACRIYRKLEGALDESEPDALTLTTRQAYEFLREVRPILLEQGFGVQAPEWWESPMARLGAKLRLESDPIVDPLTGEPQTGVSNAGAVQFGLGTLVKYRWEIAVGDTTLTLGEFEQLASRRLPLVKVNGRWVEIRPEDVQNAIRFIRDNPGGEMRVGDAMRLAYASDLRETGIPVIGLEATGWLSGFLNSESLTQAMSIVEPPKTFIGTLRPYQIRGVSWMSFMERLGFGLCLADDMGLGKTIQLLALMAFEREHAPNGRVGPTLLMVPMSVVGNWIHETRRFCPSFRVLLHHGADRLMGDSLTKAARESDLVITTYALANRDKDALGEVPWWRLVLDEAQYIKNPLAKQTQAVRSLKADRRVALTGTPVENRLTELWSIMDFLNPGYLGTSHSFRQRFGVAIERYHDRARSDQLRGLIKPFILRRVKTDPTVVADLPAKVESREFAHLTSEQASLYESCVRRMLSEVDEVDGIQRRGLVLSALVRLKQICDHPALVGRDRDEDEPLKPLSAVTEIGRSGKCIRIMEMLEEILAEGDKALIFTQFRQMGHLLASIMRHHFQRNVLFLHGGTTQTQRDQMVRTFQSDAGAPILLLSLKAGGVGLNLTAATHVFHFDRWWNPAVENQATDRAYRIGQTRTVQVHKFVVRGTLEERIDQMIESKIALAENIIGSGEQWLTELGTDQLRDILTLRNDAVSDEE